MGQGSWVRRVRITLAALAMVLLGGLFAGTSAAVAEQTSAKTAEPKRSYGAVNVVLYQLSW